MRCVCVVGPYGHRGLQWRQLRSNVPPAHRPIHFMIFVILMQTSPGSRGSPSLAKPQFQGVGPLAFPLDSSVEHRKQAAHCTHLSPSTRVPEAIRSERGVCSQVAALWLSPKHEHWRAILQPSPFDPCAHSNRATDPMPCYLARSTSQFPDGQSVLSDKHKEKGKKKRKI